MFSLIKTSEYTTKEDPIGTRRKFSSDSSSELTFDRLFNSGSRENLSKNQRKPNLAEAKGRRKNFNQRKHSQRPQAINLDKENYSR